jgi:hypothetical protein
MGWVSDINVDYIALLLPLVTTVCYAYCWNGSGNSMTDILFILYMQL